FGERLRDHAKKYVMADLDDARELAFADVARGGSDHLEIGQRLVVRVLRTRADERKPAGLDHLGIARTGCGEELHAPLRQKRTQLRGAFERDRRALDQELRRP